MTTKTNCRRLYQSSCQPQPLLTSNASPDNPHQKWHVDGIMTQPLPSQLRRYPSASQSLSGSTEGRDHQPLPSSHTSSNSVYELPANSTPSKYSPQPPSGAHASRARDSTCQSLNERSSDEAIGALSGLSKVNSTKASGYQNSLRRPAPPPLSQTTPDVRTMNPSLRQSASFSIGDRTSDTTPPSHGSGSGTPKRYSDEARNTAPWKKKSSFSSFMTTVLGSPRNVKISNPENPVHVTHVGFDNETGQFTVSQIRSSRLGFVCSRYNREQNRCLWLPHALFRDDKSLMLTTKRGFQPNGNESLARMVSRRWTKSATRRRLWTS